VGTIEAEKLSKLENKVPKVSQEEILGWPFASFVPIYGLPARDFECLCDRGGEG
jgi:hypothetical protein